VKRSTRDKSGMLTILVKVKLLCAGQRRRQLADIGKVRTSDPDVGRTSDVCIRCPHFSEVRQLGGFNRSWQHLFNEVRHEEQEEAAV